MIHGTAQPFIKCNTIKVRRTRDRAHIGTCASVRVSGSLGCRSRTLLSATFQMLDVSFFNRFGCVGRCGGITLRRGFCRWDSHDSWLDRWRGCWLRRWCVCRCGCWLCCWLGRWLISISYWYCRGGSWDRIEMNRIVIATAR